MRIVGKWYRCDDGIIRPIVETNVLSATGQLVYERFLVDTGSDCTVLSADLLQQLHLTGRAPHAGLSLKGISGAGNYVVVATVMEFLQADGGPARVRGDMAAFTDPTATDLSILGRDVLDHFDVLISRRRDEVLLLAGDHNYHVSTAKPNGSQ
jgi:hypothetical protein